VRLRWHGERACVSHSCLGRSTRRSRGTAPGERKGVEEGRREGEQGGEKVHAEGRGEGVVGGWRGEVDEGKGEEVHEKERKEGLFFFPCGTILSVERILIEKLER